MKRIMLMVLLALPMLLFAQKEAPTFEQLKAKGLALFESGDFKPAIKTFSEALALNDKDTRLYEKRGIAYKWQAKPELAFDDFSKAIEGSPSASLYAHRSDVREYSDISGKMEDLNKAVELDNTEFNYVYKLAMAKFGVLSDYKRDHPNAVIAASELEEKFGFANDICVLMKQAGTLNTKFKSKAEYYCTAVNNMIR